MPLFFPTLFATSQLRNAGAAVNTIRNKLADIAVLLRWESLNHRVLIAEFAMGRFLSLPDIVSIRDFAHLDMREVSAPKARANTHQSVVSFLEARMSVVAKRPIVAGHQHYNRLTTIADYLEFTALVVTQHKNSPEDAMAIATMVKRLRRHRPRGLASRVGGDPFEKSPDPDLVARFMEVASEGHLKNPFRDPGVQLRNAVIFGLLYHTGMRRGELLSVRIDQCDLGNEPLVWVRRNQDDPFDARRYQPVAKSKERPLPIPRELADQIQRYILNERASITPARKHPYLIVSHKKGEGYGRPLSATALGSQIMAKMRSVDSDFAALHPHAFRHHFNHRLSLRIDAANRLAKEAGGVVKVISEAQELDMRAFLNGHRSRASGATYNQRHIRELSDMAVRQLQAEILKGK
ncbi:site-specific integrase [Cupriavidus oxalaticus]|uniref:site-specific integrase n=1 Tax=Cupriavidus oxalaticus TaxID=96344 RepID=UPI004034051C